MFVMDDGTTIPNWALMSLHIVDSLDGYVEPESEDYLDWCDAIRVGMGIPSIFG